MKTKKHRINRNSICLDSSQERRNAADYTSIRLKQTSPMPNKIVVSLLATLISGFAYAAPSGTPTHKIVRPDYKPTVVASNATSKTETKKAVETQTVVEPTVDANPLQISPYPVSGKIEWSDKADKEQTSFYAKIAKRSDKILLNDGLFWQDTDDNEDKITGRIAATEYCTALVVDVDGLAVSGFRSPKISESGKESKIKFKTAGPGGKTENKKRTGAYSAHKKNNDFTRCVSDKLELKTATLHDIALFLSKNKNNYLKSLEKAVNIKYGKPVLVASFDSKRITADITSREIKEGAYSTSSELHSALSSQLDRLVKKQSSRDKYITIKGVYNFKHETIIELKVNKRLQGFNLSKLNANYAIVDPSKKKGGSGWSDNKPKFMHFPYQSGNIYYELQKGSKVYFSVPRITSNKFDFVSSFIGGSSTGIKNVKLRYQTPSQEDFSQFEFAANTEITIENGGFDSLQKTMDKSGFVPTISLTITDGLVRFWSIEEVDRYKNKLDKTYAKKKPVAQKKIQVVSNTKPKPVAKKPAKKAKPDQKAILALSYNSISALNKFIVEYPGTAHTATATKQVFDLSFNSIDKLNTFIVQHPKSELKGAALTQVLALSYNSTDDLNQFIKDHPDSKLTSEASKQIAVLDANRKQQELAHVEYKKDHAYGTIVGPRTIDSSKYLGGLIWQDSEANSSYKSHNYSAAKKYCSKLDLLGVNKWRLPSKADFEELDGEITELTHKVHSSDRSNFYFTETDQCKKDGKSKPASNSCVYVADISASKKPNIAKLDKSSSASVRCVLSTYNYNKHQKKLASINIKEGGFDGYLNSFRATGNQNNIQKAYKYAKGQQDKATIELALIEHFGIDSAFEVSGKLQGQNDAGETTPEIDTWTTDSIDPEGGAVVNITATKKGSSNIHLKHGSFKVKVHVRLDLRYKTAKKGSKKTEMEYIEQTAWITLDKGNNFSNSTQLDFDAISQAAAQKKGSKVSRTLESISPTISFDGIEQI